MDGRYHTRISTSFNKTLRANNFVGIFKQSQTFNLRIFYTILLNKKSKKYEMKLNSNIVYIKIGKLSIECETSKTLFERQIY